MSNLPLEIFEQIVLDLVEYTQPTIKRFSSLTPTLRRSILSVRAVWSHYRHQDPLRRLFLSAIEEVPFMFRDPSYGAGGMSGLTELSRSHYARFVTTLSLCPMDYFMRQYDPTWLINPFFLLNQFYLIISRFPRLEHVRLHIMPARNIQGEWTSSELPTHVWRATDHNDVLDVDEGRKAEIQARNISENYKTVSNGPRSRHSPCLMLAMRVPSAHYPIATRTWISLRHLYAESP
jgi:hypothetical protein